MKNVWITIAPQIIFGAITIAFLICVAAVTVAGFRAYQARLIHETQIAKIDAKNR